MRLEKKKHGLSPWQLSALANVIESFTFLYAVVATAGILWYTINVKDNYLINSVLYTTITNMILSIFLTGPMYHLLLDGFIPAMASFFVRTDVLRYLQEEELQNVNREEGDSDSDSETDDQQIEALESGTKNIKLVASQTNPMLLVGARGDLLHTPSDLDAMSAAERQKIVSHMTIEERDALKERETRQTLSLVSESVHAAMNLGVVGTAMDNAIADLRFALAKGWQVNNEQNIPSGTNSSTTSLELPFTSDVEKAMMLLADHESRAATPNESPAYQLSMREQEIRNLSLGLRKATSCLQMPPKVVDVDVRALVDPISFVATCCNRTHDAGRVRRASLSVAGDGVHARVISAINAIPNKALLHRRPSFSHPYIHQAATEVTRADGVDNSLDIARQILLVQDLEAASKRIPRDISSITWDVKEQLHTDDYPLESNEPEEIVGEALYRLELEDWGDFEYNMQSVAEYLGIEMHEHSSAAGRALIYFQQPQQLIPYTPHQPDYEMRSTIARAASSGRKKRLQLRLKNEGLRDQKAAKKQIENDFEMQEADIEGLKHESHRRHNRRHTLAAPERTAAYAAIWNRHHELVSALRRNPGRQSSNRGRGSSIRVHRSGARSADPFEHVVRRLHHNNHDEHLIIPIIDTPQDAKKWYEYSREIVEAAEVSGVPSTPLPRIAPRTPLGEREEDKWDELIDDEGTPYYLHRETGEAVWEKPSGDVVNVSPDETNQWSSAYNHQEEHWEGDGGLGNEIGGEQYDEGQFGSEVEEQQDGWEADY